MGLEAYRIRLEQKQPIPKQDIIDQFINQGFIICDQNFGDTYLEKAYKYGYVEIKIHNSEQHRIALNRYKSEHNRKKYEIYQPANNEEVIIIQIAKPNHENIIDSLISDLDVLNHSVPITVINLQTKKPIDIKNYSDLKKHFKSEHDEFGRWYQTPVYPVRCKDVFKLMNK